MAIYDRYHKLHSLSTLIVSFPNGMSTVIRIVSTREHDFTILTQSELDEYLYNLCQNNDMPIYSLYADKGFSGVWLSVRTPHRRTLMFPLNSRQLRENHIMKKIRVQIKQTYGEVLKYWKLVGNYLFFKLDQNQELCIEQICMSFLLSNF